jgi:uncharacterized SAM-binding protein YcdF (DUF218 family)
VIRRLISLALIVWLLGLAWFVVSLPRPAGDAATDAIVVLTGGKGRIERGIELLKANKAKRMLVSGVDPTVRPEELAAVQDVSPKLFACCIDLGKQAVDTRSNAEETARWIAQRGFRTVRLVTTDWHMPRAQFELKRALAGRATIVADAVDSEPSLAVLFREYNKLLARRVAALIGI